MPIVKNPTLAGSEFVQRVGARMQAVPPNWRIFNNGVTNINPAPEIFNDTPSGSKMHVSYRILDSGYLQTVTLEPGLYLLKTQVERKTKPSANGSHTDLGWGFVVYHGSTAYSYRSETKPWGRQSDSGESLAVIEVVDAAVEIDFGLKVDTTFGSIDGEIIVKLLDIEAVTGAWIPTLTLKGTKPTEPPPPPPDDDDEPTTPPDEPPPPPSMPGDWTQVYLTERERKELAFAQIYAEDYAHGTDGHNRLLLIAKMADIIDKYYPTN